MTTKSKKIKKTEIRLEVQKNLQKIELIKQKGVLKQNILFIILLVVINCIVFGKILGFNYVDLDDLINLVEKENAYFVDFSNFFKGFETSFIATFYRPFLWGSWIIDSQFHNFSDPKNLPVIFHFSNLMYHVGSVVLLYRCLCLLKINLQIAFLVSLLFSLHPLFVQAIGWIPGRNDTILTIFTLASFNCFVLYLNMSKLKFLIWHFIFLVFSLFTKETAIALPAICFVYYFLNFSKQPLQSENRTFNKNLLRIIIIWILIALVWYFIRKHALDARIFSFYNVSDTSKYKIRATGEIVGWEAFKNNFSFLFESIGKFILPVNLSVYPSYSSINYYIGIGAYVLLILGCLGLKIPFKKCFFGFLWWFIFLIPPMLLYFNDNRYDYLEHRIYTPAVGIAFILALGIENLRIYLGKIVLYITGFWVLILAIMSFNRIDDFKDVASFYTSAVHSSPNKLNPYRALADYYNRNDQNDLAMKYYEKLVQVNPSDINIVNFIASYYTKNGKYDSALHYYQIAFSQKTLDYDLYCGYADYLDKVQKQDSSDYYYRIATILKPTEWIPYHNIAYYAIQKGQYDSAEKYYNKVLTLNPNQVNSLWGLGVVYVKKNKIPEAIAVLNKAIKVNPEFRGAYINLLHIQLQLGNLKEAKRIYDIAKTKGIDLSAEFPVLNISN
ncbi:MAG: tetratricopeptide repeat protein [Alphaproteobacteria bacterium]|nr:tetratricopeptide repeat protein [Alphaproteobacteria bacterium]